MDILLDPNIAYVLLVFGVILAVLAVLTPGTGLLEVGAIFAFLLAGWAVYNLTINYWALAILLVGVIPFMIAVRRSGQLIYLVISILALILGSVYLFRGEGLRPAVNPILAVIVSGITGAVLWVTTTKTLDALGAQPVDDLGKVVGAIGEARTDIHDEGTVYVSGEIWSARSAEHISAGDEVRVVRREGFVLEVEPLE